jgi:hypothetical protein
MWQEQQEQQQEVDQGQQQDTLAEELWQLGCAMNSQRLAEIDADMEPHKRTGYAERMYEQADMRRKELRENGA